MKLLLCFALLVFATVLSAQEPARLDTALDGNDDRFDDDEPEIGEVEVEEPDEEDQEDDDDFDDEDGDRDGDGDEDGDQDEDEDEDEDEEENPTTEYPRRRWPGSKCFPKAQMCFMNATDCNDELACFEEKSRCIQAVKKEKDFGTTKKPSMICKNKFTECMESAGDDCILKVTCYAEKGMCYRNFNLGHRRPHHRRPHHRRPHHRRPHHRRQRHRRPHHRRPHHRRPHHHRPHHHRRPTMCPKMLKCKIEWRRCFMRANNCSDRLACMYSFHDCMNRSRPTRAPQMSGDLENDEDMTVNRRRWNPKLMAKCKDEFKECIGNATSCPLKMRCFFRMKMCFMSHRRRPDHDGKMFKCKNEWKGCFMQATNCDDRLGCMYRFHDCMNRSRPTRAPQMSGDLENDEDMTVNRRRWNPKLMAKCKDEFKECIENATNCPSKMRCFWRMKMCFMSHGRRPDYDGKMVMETRGHFSQFGKQTERTWRPTVMGTKDRFHQLGRQMGRTWKPRFKDMRNRFERNRRQWGDGGIRKHIEGQRREWKTRGQGLFDKFKRVFKPMKKKMKNIWQRRYGNRG